MRMPEPLAWAMQREDGLVFDVICPEEHEKYEGQYTLPLYEKQALIDLLEAAAVECEYKGPAGNPIAVINSAFAAQIRSMKEKL